MTQYTAHQYMSDRIPQQQAYRLVALQMLLVVFISLVWLLMSGQAAISAFLGGLCAVLPNVYFVHRFFAVTSARQITRILRSFYWGELTKLLLSAALVIGVTHLWEPLVLSAFFSGFIGAYFSVWFAPLVMRK